MTMDMPGRFLKGSDLMKFATDADGTIRATVKLSEDDANNTQTLDLGGAITTVQIFSTFHMRAWVELPSSLTHQLSLSDKTANKGLFSKYVKYQLDEHINSILSKRRMLELDCKITHAGRSSIKSQSYVKSDGYATVLAAMDLCHIHVNLATRRPDPIPEYFREELNNLPKPEIVSLDFGLPDTFDVTVFSRLCKVEETFLDENGHVNMFIYQLLILKCVQSAFADRLLIKGSLKEFVIEYAGESVLGDILRTYIWKVDENTLHVMVTKSEQNVVSAKLVFNGRFESKECTNSPL